MEKVANFAVKTVDTEQDVLLNTFWAEGPCIIYFLRRFGCQICRWQAKQVSELAPILKEKHIRLIAIGPERLGWDEFVQEKFWDGDVYYDPEKKLYVELGMKRAGVLGIVGGMLNKKTWDIVGKSRSSGVKGNFKGDYYQLGGLFVVDKGGQKLLYEFRQNDFSEHADVRQVAKSLGIDFVPTASSEQQPICSSESCTLPSAAANEKKEECCSDGVCEIKPKPVAATGQN